MIILGIDLGDARTGLAISSKSELLARPLITFHIKGKDKLLAEIISLIETEKAEMVVIGNPLNMDGSAGERSAKSVAFSQKLASLVDIPVRLWDERLSTVSATFYMNETNVRGKKRKDNIDAMAASIILENFMNFRKNNKDSN